MTSRDAIRVKHGNKHENEVFSEQMSPHIIFVKKEFDDSGHGVTWRGLDGMDTGRNENDGFVSPKSYYFLIAERHPLYIFIPFPSFMRRNDNKVQNPSFVGFIEKIKSKEELFIVFVLLIQLL